jgi:hypothetical protein
MLCVTASEDIRDVREKTLFNEIIEGFFSFKVSKLGNKVVNINTASKSAYTYSYVYL